MMAVSATDLDQVAVPKILDASCVEREHPRAFVFLDCSKKARPANSVNHKCIMEPGRVSAQGAKKSRRRRLLTPAGAPGWQAFDLNPRQLDIFATRRGCPRE